MYTSEDKIERFIEEYARSRVIIKSTVKAVLKRAIEYEDIYDKPFYRFDKETVLKIYSDAKSRSANSLMNWNLILKHASKYMLREENEDLDSAYELITMPELQNILDINKKDRMLIGRKQLDIMQGSLINYTDKAILELLFLGVNGEWAKELTYLQPYQISERNMCIYLMNGKNIPLDQRAYNIITEACKEQQLISYNESTSRVSKVIGDGIYKIRSNSQYENNDITNASDVERRFRWLQRRLMMISDFLDVPMTVRSLNSSGFWHYSMENQKELNISDFKEYLQTQSGNKMAQRYGFDTDRYVDIIMNKYNRYIE